jgi:hypothetical protein
MFSFLRIFAKKIGDREKKIAYPLPLSSTKGVWGYIYPMLRLITP